MTIIEKLDYIKMSLKMNDEEFAVLCTDNPEAYSFMVKQCGGLSSVPFMKRVAEKTGVSLDALVSDDPLRYLCTDGYKVRQMREEIEKMDDNMQEAVYENIIRYIEDEMESDTERWSKKGRSLCRAILQHDADGVLLALCGWSMPSIIEHAIADAKAELGEGDDA